MIEKLDTGDYSLAGMENSVCIERKGSVTEWAGNILEARFVRELERMAGFQYKYIVLEFTAGDLIRYPLGLPQNLRAKIKINGQYLLAKTLEFELEYGVKIIFAGNYGKEYVLSLFKRIYEKNNR